MWLKAARWLTGAISQSFFNSFRVGSIGMNERDVNARQKTGSGQLLRLLPNSWLCAVQICLLLAGLPGTVQLLSEPLVGC